MFYTHCEILLKKLNKGYTDMKKKLVSMNPSWEFYDVK